MSLRRLVALLFRRVNAPEAQERNGGMCRDGQVCMRPRAASSYLRPFKEVSQYTYLIHLLTYTYLLTCAPSRKSVSTSSLNIGALSVPATSGSMAS